VRNLRPIILAMFISVAVGSGAISAHAAEPTAVGSIGIRIAQIPSAIAEHPYASAYIVSRMQPGVAHTQRLEIYNTSSQQMKVDVYPGLATFVSGKFLVGNGRDGNTFTTWIKLTPNTLTLKPNESKPFNLIITPPADADSIQHFGVIWAEVQGAPNASGIISVSRVGIRMYVPIGSAPEISILEKSMTSSTNEIVIKKSFISNYVVQVIITLVFLSIVLIFLFFFLLRRGNSDRKFRKENEKRLEAQWKQERDRRRKIWKNKGILPQRDPSPRYYDEYEEEN
jgi:hypothetical protein